MLLRVSPDDLAGGAAWLGGDGPLLRGLAAMLATGRRDVAAAVGDHQPLATVLARFMSDERFALGTLADSVELLAEGLLAAASQYREAETAALTLVGAGRG